jgi:hypothetical protein
MALCASAPAAPAAIAGQAAATRPPDSVELAVTERLGLDRFGEPVTMGVPFPEGALKDVQNVRLLRDGKEIAAQFRVTGLWLPKGSVRWLLVDFQTDIRANETQRYVMEYGPGVRREASPASAVRVAQDDAGYTVDTGAAVFRISRKVFSLFDEVKLADTAVLVAPPAQGAVRFGAQIRRFQPNVTRPVAAAGNQGASHLIYAKNRACKAIEDYTLRFRTDVEYELTGLHSGAVGNGFYGRDFVSTDGKLSIPGDAWLAYARPKPGDVYEFCAVPQGASAVSEGVLETALIEHGPLRSVICVKGAFGQATAAAMEYTAWYHFFAGSPRVKLVFTLENNRHGARDGANAAAGPLSDIGGVNCVLFGDMRLILPLALGSRRTVSLLGDAGSAPIRAPLASRTELYQDSGGGERWNRYKDPKFHPRPASYVSFKGYQVLRGADRIAEGNRAVGWLDVSDEAKGLTVAVRDFWQNCPKGLAAEPDGRIEIGLFPARYAGEFPFRTGEHKTHELLFFFHKGDADAARGMAAARGFSDPLRLEPSPEWFAKTRALGELRPYDLENYRSYETLNLSTIGLRPDGGKSKTSLIEQVENYNFFCWMDYGDVPLDFEGGTGQWGMKYDLDYHMAQQYARTLQPDWWKLFVAAGRHVADIDIHHQPHLPGIHWTKGGSWAHSQHSEPGHKNPHRNYGRFTKDLCFGARGTATLYYLTGDWKARHACLELADNALAQYMSPQSDPGDPKDNNRIGWRGDACTLERLLEGYLLTGEPKYLARARWQIKSCAFDGRPPKLDPHGPVSTWSTAFYVMALARYVEMFPEDHAAKSYLLAHITTLYKAIDPKLGLLYSIVVNPDGSVTPTSASPTSHYNVQAADWLAIGYRLTGNAKYLATARACFSIGVHSAGWGTDSYTHVHNANGATHGNVFMVLDGEMRAGGK